MAIRVRSARAANPAAPSRVPGIMKTTMLPRRALIFLAFAWVLVMLYPDPGMLVRSVRNTVRPQIQPEAVAALAARLPDDPRAIEAYVLDEQVPYAYDWQSAGVPWYFPTTAEAVRAGARRLREQGRRPRQHPHRQGHPQRAAPEPRPHLGGLPRQAGRMRSRTPGVQFAGTRERPLLPALAEGLPAGPGGLRPAGDLLDAGAGVARAAARRRPLADHRSGTRWRGWLGAGRRDGDGLLPAEGRSRRRRRGRRAGGQAPAARGAGAVARPQRA